MTDFPEPDPIEEECYTVEYTIFYSDAWTSEFVPVIRGKTGVSFSEDEAGIATKHHVTGDLLRWKEDLEDKTAD